LEGRVINNKFLVREKLGAGKAGDVYKAKLQIDTDYGSKGNDFAIKVYNSWVLSRPYQIVRINRELKSSIKINSEYVVKSYELIRWEDGLVLIMEYLKGETLSKYLEENKKLSFGKIIEIFSQILKGLEKIHKNGLIHRDMKPDNIMLVNDHVIIMDLGVLKDLNSSLSITETQFLGTIKYAAPEYLFDENYDKNIDLCSLGLILYELIFDESLNKTNSWAIQVVEHYLYKESGPSEFIKHYTEFPDRFNQNEKIFLWILLNSLLENKNYRIGIKSIINALEEKIWDNLINWEISESQIIRYQKKTLRLSNYIAIKDIEKLLGKPIPLYKDEEGNSLSFTSSNGYIISLNLRNGRLKTLPESIGYLKGLKSLYLVGNDIIHLPPSFSELESLTFLNLLTNRSISLPKDFNKLSNLEILSLDLFHGNQFPSVISELASLSDLYIWGHKTEILIPNSFKNLHKLEKLTLMCDSLILPTNFGQLKSLKTLFISTDKTSKIPLTLWELENLVELNFKVEGFTSIPPEIKNLNRIEILNLNGNPLLNAIPSEIEYLENLRILEFHDTDITELPIEILKLNKLEEIYGTFEFVYRSETAKKLEEKGVNVISYRYETGRKNT